MSRPSDARSSMPNQRRLLAAAIGLSVLLVGQTTFARTRPPTPTQPCPVPTREPLWVEPVTSPTDQLAQVIRVYTGNSERVEVSAESGTFAVTEELAAPIAVPITLLPDTTHHLVVTSFVKQTITPSGCVFGGYTLRTAMDSDGNALTIVQQTGPLPVTSTPTPTPTPAEIISIDLGIQTISGVVFDVTGHEAPIPNARVTYELRGPGTFVSGSVTAGEDGRYQFDLHLHDVDSIVMTFAARGYDTAQHTLSGLDLWRDPVVVALLHPAPVEQLRHTVTGVISYTAGEIRYPFSFATVRYEVSSSVNPPASGTVTADFDGRYQFEVMLHDTDLITITADGPWHRPARVTLSGAELDHVDLVLEPLELPEGQCPPDLALEESSGAPGAEIELVGRCYFIHSGGRAELYFDDIPLADLIGETSGCYRAILKVPPRTAPGPHMIRVLAHGEEIAAEPFQVTASTEPCVGDANEDGEVRVNELVLGVGIVMGTRALADAPSLDADGSQTVEINELVMAVENALLGCP